MPTNKINGVKLYWELSGEEGEPLVFVHGSWGDHHNWDGVVGELSRSFRVLTYDRRGHSQSERPNKPETMEQDVSDLIALIQFFNLAPAHIVGNSGGAAIVLKTASSQPELFKTMVVHEPPLFGLLKNVPEAKLMLQEVNNRIEKVTALLAKGENEEAAKQFVETIAFGPGGWEKLPEQGKQTFIYNAPTFYDETKDSGGLELDTSKLSSFNKPALLTHGTQSPPFFPMVLDQIAKAMPNACRKVFEGAGHVPHLSHPKEYIEVVKDFCSTSTKPIRQL
jgi:pimeloyl-ACP methyl ester carboxylesterase